MKKSYSQQNEVGFDDFEDRPRRKASPGEVIHADDSLVVALKAPGAWAEPGMDDEPGLAPLLVQSGYFDDESEAVPVFPVEPAISGLVIYPRHDQARQILLKQVAGDELVLRCIAVVRGHVLESQGTITGDAPQRMKVGPVVGMLSARTAPPATHWTLRDSFVGFAVLDCQPLPPLPTLVRAHLESAGMPLAVDSLYGGAQELMLSSFKAGYRPSQRHEERPLISRVSLHASSLSFIHPATRMAAHFEAPLPKDMKAALHQLDRFGRIGK